MCSLFCQSDTPIKNVWFILHTQRWGGVVGAEWTLWNFPYTFAPSLVSIFFSSSQRKGNPIHRLGSSLEQYLDTQFAFVGFDSDEKKKLYSKFRIGYPNLGKFGFWKCRPWRNGLKASWTMIFFMKKNEEKPRVQLALNHILKLILWLIPCTWKFQADGLGNTRDRFFLCQTFVKTKRSNFSKKI